MQQINVTSGFIYNNMRLQSVSNLFCSTSG